MKDDNQTNAEEEVIFPPLLPLTHVRTTEDNLSFLNDVPLEIYQYDRIWVISGMVLSNLTDEEVDYYLVYHDDGTIGGYHVTELRIDQDHDGNDGDEPLQWPDNPLDSKPIKNPVHDLVLC